MEWVNDYVGLPFKARGRTKKNGLDCWGLVRVVYKDRAGIILPSYSKEYKDPNDHKSLGNLIPKEAEDWVEVPARKVRELDVLVLRMRGAPMHTALVAAPGFMLHVHEGTNTVLESYRRLTWRDRIVGFYRHRDLV